MEMSDLIAAAVVEAIIDAEDVVPSSSSIILVTFEPRSQLLNLSRDWRLFLSSRETKVSLGGTKMTRAPPDTIPSLFLHAYSLCALPRADREPKNNRKF
jgi:hypothetical protein